MENIKYISQHNNNEDARIIDNTIEEVREGLRFKFQSAYTIVEDGRKELEDDFLYCSKSRFESIDNMNFEQLKEEYDNFDWTLTMVNE